jgi:flagellar hook-associated protein 1 FlgK
MSLLSIGKSGLYAAQAALSTTGHNITNANVAGYSRQVVVQETSIAMGGGNGYIGTGTQIAQVKRYSDEFLNAQVRTAQASTSGWKPTRPRSPRSTTCWPTPPPACRRRCRTSSRRCRT